MDITEIRTTYDRLAAAAELGVLAAAAPDEWPTEKILAHVIATNQTLIRLGIELLDGRLTSYEGGTLSVRDPWLDSIIESAGEFSGLVAYTRQSYRELLTLASRFDEPRAAKQFHGTIYDGRGNIQIDSDMSFEELVTKYLVVHMRNHTKQIEALAGAAAPA